MNARWAINDDLENEFRYWLRGLLAALKHGTVLAIAAGLLIALLPGDRAAFVFARDFWPYLVEIAFWLGMLVAMLWSAARRAFALFTGVLPWEKDGSLGPARYPETD